MHGTSLQMHTTPRQDGPSLLCSTGSFPWEAQDMQVICCLLDEKEPWLMNASVLWLILLIDEAQMLYA